MNARRYRPTLNPGPKVEQLEGQLDLLALLAEDEPAPAPAAGPAPAARVPGRVMSPAEAAWVAEQVIERWTDANDSLPGADPHLVEHMEPGCQRAGRPLDFVHGRSPHLRPEAPCWPVWLADDPHLRAATPRTSVVDLHGHQGDPAYADVVYVGRPMYQGGWHLKGHPLSNPFKAGRDGDPAAVVARYREWLLRRPGLVDQLLKLRGRRLGCWCAEDQPCHARVLAELADQIVTDSPTEDQR